MDARDKCKRFKKRSIWCSRLWRTLPNGSCFSFNNMLTACCAFSPATYLWNGAGQDNCLMETTAWFEEIISVDFQGTYTPSEVLWSPRLISLSAVLASDRGFGRRVQSCWPVSYLKTSLWHINRKNTASQVALLSFWGNDTALFLFNTIRFTPFFPSRLDLKVLREEKGEAQVVTLSSLVVSYCMLSH